MREHGTNKRHSETRDARIEDAGKNTPNKEELVRNKARRAESALVRMGGVAGGIFALAFVGGKILELASWVLFFLGCLAAAGGVVAHWRFPLRRPWPLTLGLFVPLLGVPIALILKPSPPEPPPFTSAWICVEETLLLSEPDTATSESGPIATLLRGDSFDVKRYEYVEDEWWAFGSNDEPEGWIQSADLCPLQRIVLPPQDPGAREAFSYRVSVQVVSRNKLAALSSNLALSSPKHIQICNDCRVNDGKVISDLAAGTELIFLLTDETGQCPSDERAHALVRQVSQLEWTIHWDDQCGHPRGDRNYADLVITVSAAQSG